MWATRSSSSSDSKHNVISGSIFAGTADGTFCSPNDMNCTDASQVPFSDAGVTYSHTFTASGDFNYFCNEHLFENMTGEIKVN